MDLINLGGLWVAKTKKGRQYLRGTLGGVQILIFENENKKTEKHPDYTIMLGENKREFNKGFTKEIEKVGKDF